MEPGCPPGLAFAHVLIGPAFARRSTKPEAGPCRGLRAGGKTGAHFSGTCATLPPVRAASDFSSAELDAGRRLFAGEWDFVSAAGTMEALPKMRWLEIAFAGRSNVGKSSLINALTGRKTLVRVSHTP